MSRTTQTIVFILSTLLLSSACQEVEQPTTTLTQAQWKEVKKNILSEAPEPKYKVGANFEDKIELIGFDVSEPIVAGKPVTFTWYWKALADMKSNWKIFVHFDSKAKPFRQNLDHVPVDNMYQTSRWKKGQIIKDEQTITLRDDYPAGEAVPYIGWYKGQTRLKIANDVPKTDEAQPRVIGPAVSVKSDAKSKSESKPSYNALIVDPTKIEGFEFDGKVEDAFWKRIPILDLDPMGNAPKMPTWVKVFSTDEHLIVGARMADRHAWGTLKERDSSTWTEEVLEVFIDVNGDGKDYLELQITPTGTIFDAHFVERLGRGEGTREDQIKKAKAFNIEGLEALVDVQGTVNDDSDKDTAWTVEMKIPLKSIPGLEGAPKQDDTWAVNIYRFDRPSDKETHAYGWSTAPRGDFHQVDKFGEFKFTEQLNVRKPTLTPEMMKQIQKNIDVKIKNPGRLQNPSKLKNLGEGKTEEPAQSAPTE